MKWSWGSSRVCLISYICLSTIVLSEQRPHQDAHNCYTENRLYKGIVEDEDLNWQKVRDAESNHGFTSITTLCGAGTSSLKQCMLISNEIYYSMTKGMAPTAQCTWCVRGEQKKCMSCAFVNEEVDDGWYCSPGKSECQNGVVREEGKPGSSGGPTHLRSNGPTHVGIKRIPWTAKMFCRKLQQYMTTFKVTSPVDVGWHFTVYCRNILGEVCTDQCARLSELYNQASRPGSNSGNSQNVEDTFSDHYDESAGLIKASHPMSISKINYKMYHRDCFKCLEMDDCVPDCMDNGDCEEDWGDFSKDVLKAP